MNRFTKTVLAAFLLVGASTESSFAQDNMGIGTSTPAPSAVLDLDASDKGLLVPRMTTQQRTLIFQPATGLLVYDTDDNEFWYFDGSQWVQSVGPQGPQGPQGVAGPAGPAGADGVDGATGAQGPQGVAGLDGADGATGPQGPQGLAGADGATGPQGPQGLVGPAGADGADGATGPQGPQGVAGLDGADGATGPQGATGLQGPTGADGATGPQGATGLQGPAGADGATGPQGATGLQGPTGAVGATGPQGATGLQGPTGADGATGPQGIQGVAGPAGADGADGATGPQGPQGLVGPTGADGADGATGPIGPQGLQGVTGPQGPAGADGATGPQGAQGLAGADGADGATGPQGPQGLAGPTGAQGVTGPTGPVNMVSGIVSSAGGVVSGTGFTVSNNTAGSDDVSFSTSFSGGVPSVVVTPSSGSISGPASSLTTAFGGGNNFDGNMFDVIPSANLTINDFDVNMGTGTANVRVYYKVGTHVGFETNAAAWTLLSSATVVSAGGNQPTNLGLNLGLSLTSGQTYSFYITNEGEVNFNYTDGTAVGAQAAANGDLQILEGTGKEYPFGSSFTPRVWNGTIYYNAGSTSSFSVCNVANVSTSGFQCNCVDLSGTPIDTEYHFMVKGN